MSINQTGKLEYWVQKTIPQVYDDSLSFYELLNKVVSYLNDVITQVGENTDLSEATKQEFDDLKAWVEGEGLESRVEVVLDAWYLSGKLADIINTDVFNMKADGRVFRYQDSEGNDDSVTDTTKDAINTIIGYMGNAIAPGIRGADVGQGSEFNENVIGGNTATVGVTNQNNVVDPLRVAAHYALVRGYDNVTNALASIILGYHCKIQEEATHGKISGGSYHEIKDGDYSSINGGTKNLIDILDGGGYGFIGSANDSKVYGKYGFIGSGIGSRVGNAGNLTQGFGSFIGTGNLNTIDGQYAHIVTGDTCKALKDYSSANGKEAVANNIGERAFSNGKFAVVGDRGSSRISLSRVTTNNAATQLLTDGTTTALVLPSNSVITIEGVVTGMRTDIPGNVASFKFSACISNLTGSTVVKSKSITPIHNDGTYAVDVVGNANTYEIRVTGGVGETMRWHADMQTIWIRNI